MSSDSDYNNNLGSLRKELIRQNVELYELRQILVTQNEELEKNKSILIHQNKELQESKKRIEKTEQKYRQLFTSMSEGIMICEFVYDEHNKPVDYIIKEINPAFEKLTGIKRREALSNPASLLFGEDATDVPNLDKLYNVATGQEPIYFEEYDERLDKYFGKSVFSDKEHQFNLMFVDITERKIAEKELKLNKFAIDNSSIATFWIDFDGNINYANQFALDLLGFKENELIHKHFKDIYPRFTKERWDVFKEYIISNDMWNVESLLRKKDSSEVPVFINANLLEFKGKKHIFAYAQDISDIKQTQEKLDNVQNIFNNLTNIVFDIIIMIDQDGIISYWNQAAERKIGFTKKEAIGANVADLAVPEQHKKNFLDSLKSLVEKGTGYYYDKTVEIEVQRKDGTSFIAESSSTTIKIDDRYYSLGILRDVTEKRALNERIRKAQVQQKAIMDSFPDYIWLKDADGLFVEMNKAFTEFLGLKKEDILGKNVFDLFPPKIAEVFHSDDLEIYNNPRMKIIEEEVQLNGRDSEYYETIKIPILDDGKILGVSGIARNVTDRVRKEKALKLTQHSIDNASVGALWVVKSGKFIAVNKKMEQLSGYSKDELLELHVYDIDKEHTKESWEERWLELQNNGSYLFHREIVKKNGDTIPVEIYTQFLTYDNEEYLFAYISDITEKIEYEYKLKTIQSSIEHAPIGSLWVDSKGNVQYANKKILSILGYTKEQCMNLNIQDLEPEHTLEEWKDRWSFLKDKKEYTFISNMTSKSGQKIPVAVTTSYKVFDEKELLFGYIQDLSDKVKFNDVINRKDDDFKEILKASFDAVNIINLQGEIVFWNKASEELFGFTEQDVLGKNLRDIYIPENRQEKFNNYLESFKSNNDNKLTGNTFNLNLLKKDRTEVNVNLRISRIEFNNVQYIVSTMR